MTTLFPRRVRTALFYALRAAFRLTPMPQTARDKLRQHFLDTRGQWIPAGPKGQPPDGTLTRRPYVRSDERAIGHIPYQKGELPDPLPATLVAFYLPQFHPIPENDEWWGKGFTEWRNVTRALPQFEGHYQPKLPGDLGFYDLRNPAVMHEQARLAREYGVSAFCFYFYWFSGKTLLETPLRGWLNDKSINLEFCLCWANEKWTRTWDGRGDEVLIDQLHSPEDDMAFIAHIAEYMRDPRYLRVDGKPVLLVYRPGVLPNARETADRWRAWCRLNDIGELHLAYVQSFESPVPSNIGFDSAVEFPPNLHNGRQHASVQKLINADYEGTVLDWPAMAQSFISRDLPRYSLHRGVNTAWDNESRRPGKGRTYMSSTAGRYGDWLVSVVRSQPENETSVRPLVFINAWNEWSEGAALEPDARFGYAYLEATRNALKSSVLSTPPIIKRPCVVIHAWHVDELNEIIDCLNAQTFYSRIIVSTTAEKESSVRRVLDARGMNAEIRLFENLGRDILPFLRICNELRSDGEDLVLKLHTKRSTHLSSGDEWRRELIDGTAAASVASQIVASFSANPKLGMVVADGHCLRVYDYLGANGARLERLCADLGIPDERLNDALFPSGSMFWARISALEPLLESGLVATDFEKEPLPIDGTTAHAIERMFGLVVSFSGYELGTTNQLAGLPTHPRTYKYAQKARPLPGD